MARKIVIDEKEGSVLLGIMKENADPVMKTIEGTLDQALASLPGFITLAEAKWATSPRNPAYKAPPEPPKPKPAEHPVVKQARQEAEAKELPLLSEKGKPAAATKPEAMGIHVPDEGNLVKAAPVPVVASQAKQVIDLPPRGTPPTEQAPATSGQWEYYLEDGQGPYPTVQAAMDQVGLDKATRPSHNRWDRLST